MRSRCNQILFKEGFFFALKLKYFIAVFFINVLFAAILISGVWRSVTYN